MCQIKECAAASTLVVVQDWWVHCGYNNGDGLGFVSAQWLGHWWQCRIGQCAAARIWVVEKDFRVMQDKSY